MWRRWRLIANDLEAPAIKLQPVIADVLSELRQLPGCQLARMSGSGATCFGLFGSSRAAAAAARTLREQAFNLVGTRDRAERVTLVCCAGTARVAASQFDRSMQNSTVSSSASFIAEAGNSASASCAMAP